MADERLKVNLSSVHVQQQQQHQEQEQEQQQQHDVSPVSNNNLLSPILSPDLTPVETSPVGSPYLMPQQVRTPLPLSRAKVNDDPSFSCYKPLIIVGPDGGQTFTPSRGAKHDVYPLSARGHNDSSLKNVKSNHFEYSPMLTTAYQLSPPMSLPIDTTKINQSASPLIIDTNEHTFPTTSKNVDFKRSVNIRNLGSVNNESTSIDNEFGNNTQTKHIPSMSPGPSKKVPLEDKLDKYQRHIFGKAVSFPTYILLLFMFYAAIILMTIIAFVFIREWHSSITDLVYAGRSTIETNSHMFRRELSGRAVSAVYGLMEAAATATKMIALTFSENYLSKAYITDDIDRFHNAFVPVYSAYNEFSTMAIITQHSGAEHMFIMQRLDGHDSPATYGVIDGDRTSLTKMYFYNPNFTPTQHLAGVNNTDFEAIPFWNRRNLSSKSMVWFMDKSSSVLRSRSDVLIGFMQKIYRKKDKSLLAVTSTCFTARRISDILSSLPLTKNGKIFITSNHAPYSFIAGRNIDPSAYNPTNFSALEHPSQIVRETVKAWLANVGNSNSTNGNLSSSNFDEFLACDDTIIVNTKRINFSYNMDLILFILVPKDDVVGPIMTQYTRFNRTYSSIISSFICVTALACVISHYFCRMLSDKCKSIAKSLEIIIMLDESDMYADLIEHSGKDDLMGSSFLLNSNSGISGDDNTLSSSDEDDDDDDDDNNNDDDNDPLKNSGDTLIESRDEDVEYRCRRRRRLSRSCVNLKGDVPSMPVLCSKVLSVPPKFRSFSMSFSSYFSSPRLPPAPGSEIPTKLIVKEMNEMDQSVSRVSRMVKNFARYIPLPVVKMYMKNREKPELKLDSQRAVIMFLDVANFTRLSEQLGDAMISALNKMFEDFSNILIEHGAVIDKYIGDAIMALWNVPEEIDMPEARAAKAAIRIIRRLDQLNEDYFPSRYGCPMGLRIGLNCGDVFAGNVGIPQRMNYTVLGNNVNIAARLEPLNKELGTRILVTDSFRRACSASLMGSDVIFRCLGPTCLRGMKSPVFVHQILGDSEYTPRVIAMKMDRYRVLDRALNECARDNKPVGTIKKAYEEYLSRNGDDKAIHYFYDHLDSTYAHKI